MRGRIEGRESFEHERELFDFARSYLCEAFPNPERRGCPSDRAVELLAIGLPQTDEPISDHLFGCSPCLNAYMTHLNHARVLIRHQSARRAVWIRHSVVAAVTAAVLAMPVYLLISKRPTQNVVAPNVSTPLAAAKTSSPSQAYLPVLIDLSNTSPTRGSQESNRPSVQEVIPANSRIDLTLRLPIGSEERLYLLTLRSGQLVLWSKSERAVRQDGDTVVRALADFSRFPAGTYELRVASTERRLSARLLMRDISSDNKESKP